MNMDREAMELLGDILHGVLSSPNTPLPVDARDQLLAALESGDATLEVIEFEQEPALEVTLDGRAIGCVLLADLAEAARRSRIELPPTFAAELAARFLAAISSPPGDPVAYASALEETRSRVAMGVPEAAIVSHGGGPSLRVEYNGQPLFEFPLDVLQRARGMQP